MQNQLIQVLRDHSKVGSDALDDYGNYNLDHELSQEQIEIAARLEITKHNQQIADDQYYINGFSLRDHDNSSVNVKDLFNGGKDLLDGLFNLTESIGKVQSGKPAFFIVEDQKHYVTIALVPNEENPPKLSVQYFNSIMKPDKLLNDALLKLENDLKNTTQEEERTLLIITIASIEDAIAKQTLMANVGKDFAEELVQYLASNNLPLSNASVLDNSVDQQLGNCCGLSVAANIASVVNKTPLFSPNDAEEKRKFYKDMGSRVFQYIKTGYLPDAPVITNQSMEVLSSNSLPPQISAIDSNKQKAQSPQIQENERSLWQYIIATIISVIENVKELFGFKERSTQYQDPPSSTKFKEKESATISNVHLKTPGRHTESLTRARNDSKDSNSRSF